VNGRSLWKYMPPAGPILSLLLIGLILLSGLLYYRAVRIQRYLEPALAISRPRNEFSRNISQSVQKEFGAEQVNGLVVRTSSILVHKSLLFSEDGSLKPSGRIVQKKLASIFLSFMRDDHMRAQISLMLIGSRFPVNRTGEPNNAARAKAERMVGLMQDALFQAEPELEKLYGSYFVSAVQPVPALGGGSDTLEFRIVPSELLHIEVLQRLMKYAF
jgi:hypothetical protein